MPTTSARGDAAPLAPDEAFAILGNETRIGILHTLSEAGGPVPFTDLRDRVGFKQGGQFNYHLDKVVGHFVTKTDDGYTLRGPGKRVVQAVLSGAVTDAPVVEPTRIEEWSCPYCGGQVVVNYRQERVARYCTDCIGFRETPVRRNGSGETHEYGSLGALDLPPAGVRGRTASEILQAAFTWGYAEWLVAANDVCPRCSGVVDHSVLVCENHETTDGFCDRCDGRQAVRSRIRCRNCTFRNESIVSMLLAATTELMAFLTGHGVDLFADPWDWGWEYDEEVLSVEPFEGRFTFTVDGEALTLTVDEDLSVVDVTNGTASETT